MNNKLFVGNLSYETTDRDLSDLFSAAGTVQDAAVINDKMSGRSRGFAFVTMATDAEAQEAINQFNEREFHGRNLSVNVARAREDRPAPRGGGGFNARGKNDRRPERRW